MESFRKTLMFFLVFTAVSSFVAYRLVTVAYDKVYEAQALAVFE